MSRKGCESNKSKKDLVNMALTKAAIKFKIIRDDNICVFAVNCKKNQMLIIADKHAPLYEVVVGELGNKATNYETGIISKIINNLKKIM